MIFFPGCPTISIFRTPGQNSPTAIKCPLAPRFLAFTGLTARHDSGLQARLQMRHIGRRYGIEDGSIMTPSSTVFDLFLKYVWKRYEFFVAVSKPGEYEVPRRRACFRVAHPGRSGGGLPGRLTRISRLAIRSP